MIWPISFLFSEGRKFIYGKSEQYKKRAQEETAIAKTNWEEIEKNMKKTCPCCGQNLYHYTSGFSAAQIG